MAVYLEQNGFEALSRWKAVARRLGIVMIAVGVAMSLSACATEMSGMSAMHDGGVVMPPSGWLDFCGRNANDPSCKVVMLDNAHGKQLNPSYSSADRFQVGDHG